LGGCALLTELAAFSKCSFEFEKIESIKLASIDIQKPNALSSLGLADLAKITKALLNKELYLDMNLLVAIKNPNVQTAALNRTDWVLMIDNIEVTSGTTTDRVEIPANGTGYLPMHTTFNLSEVFSGQSKDAMFNLAKNIAGYGDTPSSVMLKIKPTLSVAGVTIPYPGWINLERKIGKAKQ
jgi:hypothetical protein